jgi:hypothetical protein
MKPGYALFVLSLAVLFGAFARISSAQTAQSGESAAAVFKQTLAEQGIEAAVDRFREMMADTTDAYDFNGRELIMSAREYVWENKQEAAAALLNLLAELWPESHWPWQELGSIYLMSYRKTEADSCYRKTVELNPDNAYVEWILENIDNLSETVRVQLAVQDRYAPGENTGIQGPYLGDEPPDMIPRIFAPGILNTTAKEFSLSFAPDGREIYFSRAGVGVLVCRWEKEGWTAPEVVRFFDDGRPVDESNVAPDGTKIFFNARPTIREERTIYVAERIGAGWGKPEELFTGMFATATLDGSIYYTEITGRPDYGVIVKRRLSGEGYSEPEVLGGGINSESPDAHPFIAPDESFLLFDSYRDQTTGLYVCFRRADGSWGDAVRLNEHLNIPPFAGQCALSPDGKYLFFALHDDMYWVNAEGIHELDTN